MKDLLNVQDYLFAVQDVGDWEGTLEQIWVALLGAVQ